MTPLGDWTWMMHIAPEASGCTWVQRAPMLDEHQGSASADPWPVYHADIRPAEDHPGGIQEQ